MVETHATGLVVEFSGEEGALGGVGAICGRRSELAEVASLKWKGGSKKHRHPEGPTFS